MSSTEFEYVHQVLDHPDDDSSSEEHLSGHEPTSKVISIVTLEGLKSKASYHFWDQSIVTPMSHLDIIANSMESLLSQEELFPSDIFSNPIDKTECYIVEELPPTAADEYEKNCHKYFLAPIEAVKLALDESSSLNLSRYRPHNLNLHFVCKALVGPAIKHITHLDLSFSPFEDEACITLSELMQQSFSLLYLNLSNCNIGSSGVKILADGIELSQSIVHLNLAKCNLRDTGGTIVAAAVAGNEVLRVLNLSQNRLHVNTAAELKNMLMVNNTLEALSIEWNDLFPEKEASVPIMNGLRQNQNLKFINLSWNGITGTNFSKALMRVMRYNHFILTIWLNNNYLSTNEIGDICMGIKRSSSIRELQLEGNLFTMDDFGQLLNAIELSPTLRNLNLGKYTYLSENLYNQAVEINNIIKEKDPTDIGITFKGQLLPNPPEPVDFRSIIINRSKYLAMKPKKKKFRRDMGHFMLSLMKHEKDHLTEEDFRDDLKKFKARLDEDLVNHFVEEFSEKVKVGKRFRKRVAIKQMAEAYLTRHPTDPPPPVKPKKKKRKNKK